MLGIVKGVVVTSLFLAYPYLVYRGIESGMVWLAPSIFSALYLLQAFAARNARIKLYKASIAIALLLGAYYLQTLTAKVLPVLIQLMLMYFFGRTLLKGKGPSFIESFVRLEFPQFPPGVSEYCRQLTWLWTAFFAFNALMCVALAVWGSDFWWTLYNGVFIYLMIGLLMIGEYVYRHFRFPDLGIPDPQSTIRTMIVNGRKIWLDVQAR
ncbi:hypothetical protein Q9L42_005650 [Methylomarinum sp. Ch1-1]|uniref:Intracellular septation protein A n=1 Tax=Methylomarinum roseum TaxID=3067653 RepID=A0AAU7NX75_9GAMM|nr:hypothetical protein [Methylomarinum sp. Ch1-1]MDP4522312.1 hypothetical protein [Methylomarinum sp. Ch1-1]